MPALDVLMIVIWLGMIFFGGTTGFLRQLLLLVSLYAAAILAGVGHPYATRAIRTLTDNGLNTDLVNGYMFFLLFLLITALLYVGLVSAFPETRPAPPRPGAAPLPIGAEPSWVQRGSSARLLDTAAGVLLGALTGLLFVVGLYAAIAYLVQPTWPSAENVRLTLLDQVNRSALQPAIQQKLPFAYAAYRPWFPVGIPGFPAF